MSTTVKKYKIQQLQANNDMLELHPETDADIVNYSKTISGTAVTTVKGALDKIVDGIGVTGVKGNAEQSYRTGQVNITPADIGAEPTLTYDNTPTANSNNPVKSSGIKSYVDSAKQDVIAIAEGKTRNIVISYTETGTDIINTSFNSDVQELRIDYSKYIKPYSGANILLSDLKVGDIISVTQTNVPDRWVAGFGGGEAILLPLEIKLDIDTTVTQNSTNPVSSGAVYNALNGEFNILSITFTGVEGITSYNGTLTEAQYNSINSRTLLLINNSMIAHYNFSMMGSNDKIHHFKAINVVGDVSLGTRRIELSEITIMKSNNSYTWNVRLYLDTDYFVTAANKTAWNAKYDKPSSGIPSSDLANSGVTAGTYTALTVNSKGLVTSGAKAFEVGATSQTTPSASLAVGGIFFKEI